MSARDNFLASVRRALGRGDAGHDFAPAEVTALSRGASTVAQRVEAVKQEAGDQADRLMGELQTAAGEAGWKVVRVNSPAEAGAYVADLAREMESRSVVRSAHAVLERMDVGGLLAGSGIDVTPMFSSDGASQQEREAERLALRRVAAEADMGLTGVDYAVAETGTCVLLPRRGVSRLVSLLPPVHVAVVERGQVLPSLDELFTLRRGESLEGSAGSYMNLITGPSRSADIEYKLVTGVHGPREVHMVLVG